MRRNIGIIAEILLFFFLIIGYDSKGQQLAFPTAEGFGKYAVGGRGGVVYEVTNLNDSGEGSLRAAVEASGARTVVFKVSGTIFLESSLRIKNDSITIAGQTAPGDGITLANYNFNVDANNVIVRYIRSRLGDNVNQEDDAFTCRNTENVIVDHCSFSWGIDEVASTYQNHNFTMQWCIISESLYSSIHAKGDHGYGGIWGGSYATFHHNLIAHHSSRNPRFNGARYEANWDEHVDHRNNVVYNWGFNSAYAGEPSEIDGNKANINVVKNYYKPGPATRDGEVKYRIVEPYKQSGYGFSYWFIDSNVVDGYPDVFDDNWGLGVQQVTDSEKAAMRSDTVFHFDIITNQNAEDAFSSVLDNVGAILPGRDTVDSRIAFEALNGTATYGASWGASSGIIDSQNDVGGWPALFSAHSPVDHDHDGMPDLWETSMGFNPEYPEDRNDDHDGDGYTNLEEYLNSITQFPDFIHPPTLLLSELSGLKNVVLTWKDNADQETGFVIEKRTGDKFIAIDTLDADTETYTDTTTDYETMYAYQVKAISLTDSSLYSNQVEITTYSENPLPMITSNPHPLDKSEYISLGRDLHWSPSDFADTYNVYISENNPPDFFAEVTDTFLIFDLSPSETYYWRVDAVNSNGSTEGDVWTFSTRPVLNEQLVGHWDFESVFKATDSTVFENHGVYTNLSSSNFDFNAPDESRAIHFNADDQYVNVPYSFEYDFDLGSFSLAFWIKQSQYGLQVVGDYPYFGKGYESGTGLASITKGFEVIYSPDLESMVFNLSNGKNQSTLSLGKASYTTNVWKHVVAQRDTTNKELKIFVDGALVTSSQDSTGDISGAADLFIGNFSSTQGYLNWYLDDLRFYNYALSEEQINEIIAANSTYVNFNEAFSGVEIFPNPTEDFINIQINLHEQSDLEIEIYDLGGKLLDKTLARGLERGSNLVEQELNDVEPGLYFLKIKSSRFGITKKLIIK